MERANLEGACCILALAWFAGYRHGRSLLGPCVNNNTDTSDIVNDTNMSHARRVWQALLLTVRRRSIVMISRLNPTQALPRT